jgi:hypothetical protein
LGPRLWKQDRRRGITTFARTRLRIRSVPAHCDSHVTDRARAIFEIGAAANLIFPARDGSASAVVAPIDIAFRARKIRVSAIFLRRGVEPAAGFAMRSFRKESFGVSIELHPCINTGCDIIPRTRTDFAGHSRIAFAMDSVVSVARFGASRGSRAGKCSHRLLKRLTARQMELIENSMTEQRLAMKIRSRLRVICATPFQKRPDSHRSKLFLYCVCMGVR